MINYRIVDALNAGYSPMGRGLLLSVRLKMFPGVITLYIPDIKEEKNVISRNS